jgi:hypothetical protein
MMLSKGRTTFHAALAVIFLFGVAGFTAAQTTTQTATTSSSGSKGSEITVEEAYLQESLETMVISEQSHSDNKDMKLVALQYIKQAIDGGRKNAEIQKSLSYLALEGTNIVTRTGGYGRPTNDYPDIRAKACDYLGEFPSVESKDALVKVALTDAEPMVLSASIRSLGKIAMNENDEVTQIISFLVNRYDVIGPDNSLAFESLVALERIADKQNGIKDPAAIRAVMRIATGNYIKPVKDKANDLLGKLRKYSGSASSGNSANSSTSGKATTSSQGSGK